jgi:hypothetical protein
MAKITDYFLDFYHWEFLRLVVPKQGRMTALKGEKQVEKTLP